MTRRRLFLLALAGIMVKHCPVPVPPLARVVFSDLAHPNQMYFLGKDGLYVLAQNLICDNPRRLGVVTGIS